MENLGYSDEYYLNFDETTRAAGAKIMTYVVNRLKPESVVDFGCGLGQWLGIAKQLGVKEVLGVENWAPKELIVLEKREILRQDISEKVVLPHKFDLAMCIEAAEHIPDSASSVLVDSLTDASDIVLFSAAIPLQGGGMVESHINEQWLSYWVEKFARKDYCLFDGIRKVFWNDTTITPWRRQNIVIFVAKSALQKVKEVFEVESSSIVDVVHPDMYMIWASQIASLTTESKSKEKTIKAKCWMFPYHAISHGAKVIIYGAGDVGRDYVLQCDASNYANIVSIVDKNFESIGKVGTHKCMPPSDIMNHEFDYILIAVNDSKIKEEIKEMLLSDGCSNKVIV